MRSPSLAKQRRLTVRPRALTRATGCRWPAISPAAAPAAARGGTSARRSPASRPIRRRARGRLGIVVAGDPDPVAAALQRRSVARSLVARRARARRRHGSCRRARSPRAARSARSDLRQPRQRRRGVIGRQQHAARAKLEPFSRCRSATTSSLSSGQYSAPAQSATSAMPPIAIATSAVRRRSRLRLSRAAAQHRHCIASFTSSASASASSASAASP